MARITSDNIVKITKNSGIQKPVSCTYNVLHSNNLKYIQFDTYGKADRVLKDQSSQTIQFDKTTAEILIDILKQEFNID